MTNQIIFPGRAEEFDETDALAHHWLTLKKNTITDPVPEQNPIATTMTLPAEEIVQIVDRANNPIGVQPRAIMRQRGLIHRASYILVFNSSGQLFIQKRTMSKDIYPGYWDVAAGGVVLAAESYETSAGRELEEELGVSPDFSSC